MMDLWAFGRSEKRKNQVRQEEQETDRLKRRLADVRAELLKGVLAAAKGDPNDEHGPRNDR